MFLKSLLKSKSVTTALHHEIANLYENLESSSALNKCHPDRGNTPKGIHMFVHANLGGCLVVSIGVHVFPLLPHQQ